MSTDQSGSKLDADAVFYRLLHIASVVVFVLFFILFFCVCLLFSLVNDL